jgi:hypothetical protein
MFLPFGFSIQEFFICYFYCQKMAFVCEFQHNPLWKLMIFSRLHTSYGHEILNLLEKVVFLDPKRLLSPFGRGKIFFSSTWNDMILQIIRNESLRFGRHIDIEVSYKILQLEIPK